MGGKKKKLSEKREMLHTHARSALKRQVYKYIRKKKDCIYNKKELGKKKNSDISAIRKGKTKKMKAALSHRRQ